MTLVSDRPVKSSSSPHSDPGIQVKPSNNDDRFAYKHRRKEQKKKPSFPKGGGPSILVYVKDTPRKGKYQNYGAHQYTPLHLLQNGLTPQAFDPLRFPPHFNPAMLLSFPPFPPLPPHATHPARQRYSSNPTYPPPFTGQPPFPTATSSFNSGAPPTMSGPSFTQAQLPTDARQAPVTLASPLLPPLLPPITSYLPGAYSSLLTTPAASLGSMHLGVHTPTVQPAPPGVPSDATRTPTAYSDINKLVQDTSPTIANYGISRQAETNYTNSRQAETNYTNSRQGDYPSRQYSRSLPGVLPSAYPNYYPNRNCPCDQCLSCYQYQADISPTVLPTQQSISPTGSECSTTSSDSYDSGYSDSRSRRKSFTYKEMEDTRCLKTGSTDTCAHDSCHAETNNRDRVMKEDRDRMMKEDRDRMMKEDRDRMMVYCDQNTPTFCLDPASFSHVMGMAKNLEQYEQTFLNEKRQIRKKIPCRNISQTGVCQFGENCWFSHQIVGNYH